MPKPISHEDDESLDETFYLLQNPVMAQRLLNAVTDVKEGNVIEHGLIDEP